MANFGRFFGFWTFLALNFDWNVTIILISWSSKVKIWIKIHFFICKQNPISYNLYKMSCKGSFHHCLTTIGGSFIIGLLAFLSDFTSKVLLIVGAFLGFFFSIFGVFLGLFSSSFCIFDGWGVFLILMGFIGSSLHLQW